MKSMRYVILCLLCMATMSITVETAEKKSDPAMDVSPTAGAESPFYEDVDWNRMRLDLALLAEQRQQTVILNEVVRQSTVQTRILLRLLTLFDTTNPASQSASPKQH